MKYNIEELRNLINTHIKSYVPDSSEYSQILKNSEIYTLESSGKRIRPVILLSVVDALGGETLNALPFAVSLEMVHTYSLIHDDLPAMDNDSVRRGKPSNHVVYGEDIAILAGDGLLTLAFKTMSGAVSGNHLDNTAIKAMNVIADSAYKMVEGQVADIKSFEPSEKSLDFIIKNKTGALFNAAVMAGAYLATDQDNVLNKLHDFADCMGTAFQIADDIKDYGEHEKSNYAEAFGLERAKSEALDLLNKADCILNELKITGNLPEIVNTIRNSING